MNRPIIKIELDKTDKAIEALTIISLVMIWLFAFFSYGTLPDIIPIHFNADGGVNGYGGKGTIFLMPMIGTILYIALTALNTAPHIFNYPVEVTEKNAEGLYHDSTRLLRFVKLTIMFLFGSIMVFIYLTAHEVVLGMSEWFMPLMVALFILPTLFFVGKCLLKK